MKAVLIDNEPPMIAGLKKMLARFCPQVDILGEAHSVASGLSLIAEKKPELVFLDVEMDDGTGLDLIRQVPAPNFALIFVTAYDDYALEAYKVSAVDYLLKPVDAEDLVQAVFRAKNRFQQWRAQQSLEVLLHNQQTSRSAEKRIVLSDAESMYVITVGEIIRCQAEGSYTRFFLSEGRELLVSRHLKTYETLLADDGFYRVHQTHLVALDQILRLDKQDGGRVIMRDLTELPLAIRRKEGLLKRLGAS
ncbi:MAG: LytTR family DNA-binding domain-containing protein [Bacteroidota bacterium]